MRFGGRNQRVIFESASDSPEQSIQLHRGRAATGVAGVLSSTHPWFPERHGGGGMSLLETSDQQRVNPLDVVERVAGSNGWAFERAGEDEITLLVTGKWSDYQVSYTWMFDIEALHLACAFELKVPERSRGEVQQLISMINEQLWVGHFDLWPQDGLVMYRHALVLAGGVEASGRQCEALLATALDSCERYFPAFQFVVWAGKPAREALDAAMFETQGQA
jgi:hypothetical protein